jgi:hypothetical protein
MPVKAAGRLGTRRFAWIARPDHHTHARLLRICCAGDPS